jgi:hypothetical protein
MIPNSKIDHVAARAHSRRYFHPAGGGESGIRCDLEADHYRLLPGIAPSDAKLGDEFMEKGHQRGGTLAMAYRLYLQHLRAESRPVPKGWGEEERESSALDFGSLYHQMILEPETLHTKYVLVNDEVRDAVLADVRARKRTEVMAKAYSGNCAEARAWKAMHGGVSPQTPEDKAQVLAAYHARLLKDEVDGIEWHSRRPEFIEWADEQKEKGLTIVWPSVWDRAEAMADSLATLPENRWIAEFLAENKATEKEATVLCANHMPRFDQTVQLKGRPDWIAQNCVIDLKTARSIDFSSLGTSDFGRQVVSMGYDLSMGAYLYQLQRLGRKPDRAFFLAQESTMPFRARVFEVSHDQLQLGATRFLRVIQDLMEALETGVWDRDATGLPIDAPVMLDVPDWYGRVIEANRNTPLFEIGPDWAKN